MLSEELKRPLGWRDILYSVLGAIFGMGISAFAITHTSDANQFILAFFLAYAFGVIAHEMGHAFVAAGMGAKVNYVRLGIRLTNRPPWKFRFLDVEWQIFGLPFSGSVQSDFYSASHYRAKRSAVIAGGPLTNLVFLAAGLLAINTPGISPSWQPAIMGWMLANFYLSGMTLLPSMNRSYGTMIPSDGLNFWRNFWISDADIGKIVKGAQARRAIARDTAAAANMTLEELLARSAVEHPSMAVLSHLSDKLRETNDPRFSACLLKLVNRPDLSMEKSAAIIDNYLTRQLDRGPSTTPEVEDKLSVFLLILEDNRSARGTRGSVLVDLGRVDEGKAMLLDVLAKTDSSLDQAYSNIFLALAEKHSGKLDKAREYAEAAKKADPSCLALPRVADLLEKADSSGA